MILLLYFYIYTNEGFYKTYLFYMLEYVEMYICQALPLNSTQSFTASIDRTD